MKKKVLLIITAFVFILSLLFNFAQMATITALQKRNENLEKVVELKTALIQSKTITYKQMLENYENR